MSHVKKKDFCCQINNLTNYFLAHFELVPVGFYIPIICSNWYSECFTELYLNGTYSNKLKNNSVSKNFQIRGWRSKICYLKHFSIIRTFFFHSSLEQVLKQWLIFGDCFMALFLFFFQVTSPNHVIPECVIGKKSWRLITVPMATPSLNTLREKFSELTRAEPHLGLNPRAPSLEGGVIHKWPCKLSMFPQLPNITDLSLRTNKALQLSVFTK